jgi:uncharacterized protein DUF3226
MPPPKDSPHQLLVEGSDDLYSVIHLMARHGFDWDDEDTVRPFVSARGGFRRLLRDIPTFLRSAAYQCIGIVLDANSDLGQRWAQIRTTARRENVDLPHLPMNEGTIIPGRNPETRIGVWVMPDNSLPGSLEHFLSSLVPAGDPLWSYADEVVNEARRRDTRCQERNHLKSALHTWLAWQEEPGLPFGTAMRAEYFGKDSEAAHRFVAWFRRLFIEA